jgi:GAF domain-containing protein
MEEVTEEDRLAALYALEILDTGPSESFDRLTSILCRVLDMPIALVCLVDKERQWFKSNAGLEGTSETPRNVAFCHHAIDSNAPEVMVVHDASKDSRFKDNPLVTGPPYIRFYAGAPIKMKDVNSKVKSVRRYLNIVNLISCLANNLLALN